MSHNHCQHSFGFCASCDVVFCKSCNREWGGHAHAYRWWPNTTWPYTVTVAGDTGGSTTISGAVHNHSA